MSKISNPEAYFTTVVKNSKKNEIRANNNSRKYIIPVGDEISKKASAKNVTEDEAIFEVLSELGVENWLLLIESKQLYMGLVSLKKEDLNFLFVMMSKGFTQREWRRLCQFLKWQYRNGIHGL